MAKDIHKPPRHRILISLPRIFMKTHMLHMFFRDDGRQWVQAPHSYPHTRSQVCLLKGFEKNTASSAETIQACIRILRGIKGIALRNVRIDNWDTLDDHPREDE